MSCTLSSVECKLQDTSQAQSSCVVTIQCILCRCDIPVIIMGETGCGKTRLVRFLCDLQKPAGAEVENMVLMKVRDHKVKQLGKYR